MHVHQVTHLLTFNVRDFVRYAGITRPFIRKPSRVVLNRPDVSILVVEPCALRIAFVPLSLINPFGTFWEYSPAEAFPGSSFGTGRSRPRRVSFQRKFSTNIRSLPASSIWV